MEVKSIEEKWAILSWKTPAFQGNYPEGYTTTYPSFNAALEKARELLKKKDKPFEWEYAIVKVVGRVYCDEPSVEITIEGDKNA